MAASFDLSLFTALDRLRFALGDTDVDAPLLDDDTYDAVLVMAGTTSEAVTPLPAEATALAVLAGGLLRKFAQRPTSFSESGGISVSWAGRLDAWKYLASGGASSAIPGTAGVMVLGNFRVDIIEPVAVEG